jgi:hypothetical protein
MDRDAVGGEVDPMSFLSSWDRVRGVWGGVLCFDCGDSSPVVSLLFSAAGRDAELEMCANNEEEDLENNVVNADVQEMTLDSEGCAQGVKLAPLEDIDGLAPLGRSMPTARWDSRHKSKLSKLPFDLDLLPVRVEEDEDEG